MNEPIRNVSGSRAAAKALVVFLCCLAALAVVGCATRPVTVEQDDPFFGTWVNEEWDKEGAVRGAAKMIQFPDGRQQLFRHIVDAEPLYEGIYSIEEAWVDRQGDRWYKSKGAFGMYKAGGVKTEEYELTRINRQGTVMEKSSVGYGYPDKVDPVSSPNYGIWYRRK